MPPAARPLRVIVLLHAVLVFVQAAAAGQFLAGHAAWLRVHETNAGIIHLVALVQLVVAILVWRPGRGPGWPALASLALLLAEEFQMGFGYARLLALHVPLGVAIFGLTVVMVVGTGRLTRVEPGPGGGPAAPVRPDEASARGRTSLRGLARISWCTLVLAALATLALPVAPAHAAPDGLRTTEVSFVGNGGVMLPGTVLAPAASTRRRPGLVMLQGAGNRGRQELRAEAEAFARRGVVTLIYDKRTVGYSLLHRDYSVLADDALAGLRLLRARADVDPASVGLWAQSEGAYVAPLAANRSTDVKFLITVGAIGVTPVRQTAWQYGEYLRHAGVSGSLAHTMQVTSAQMTVAAGLFPEANHDPIPAWEHLRQPVLAQWGELDRIAVPQESSQLIRQALERGGNTHYTIRLIPGVRHNLNRTANGGFDRIESLPPNYGDFQASWIDGLAHGQSAPAASAQPAPHQAQPSRPLAPLAWYASPWLQLAALLLFGVAFVGYPLTAAARRLRGRRGAPLVRRPARWLAATGLATTVGFLTYIFFMLVTAANVVGPVLGGRPIPWLILQLLAVATVVATVATAAAWRRHRRNLTGASHARLGVLLAAGLVFLPWAAYWGLLIP